MRKERSTEIGQFEIYVVSVVVGNLGSIKTSLGGKKKRESSGVKDPIRCFQVL